MKPIVNLTTTAVSVLLFAACTTARTEPSSDDPPSELYAAKIKVDPGERYVGTVVQPTKIEGTLGILNGCLVDMDSGYLMVLPPDLAIGGNTNEAMQAWIQTVPDEVLLHVGQQFQAWGSVVDSAVPMRPFEFPVPKRCDAKGLILINPNTLKAGTQ